MIYRLLRHSIAGVFFFISISHQTNFIYKAKPIGKKKSCNFVCVIIIIPTVHSYTDDKSNGAYTLNNKTYLL